jgi:multicomponent Na+:H+ antiporter subunit B
VGGLVASAAVILYGIACGTRNAAQLLRTDPRTLIGAGLLVAMASGLMALLGGEPVMTGKWASLPIPGVGAFHLGTPLLFDMGVYLVVLGTVLTIILSLVEE